MKKGFTKLGLLTLLGLLVACGGTSSETPTTSSPEDNSNTSESTSSEDITSSEESTSSEETTSSEDTTNYGTEESPLSIGDAYTLIKGLGKDNSSSKVVYITGIVSSVTAGSNNQYKIDLKDSLDSSKIVQIYWGDLQEGVNIPCVGDTINANGYAKNYNDYTMELCANNDVTPIITYSAHNEYTNTFTIENGTISGLPEKSNSGDTITFTVSADSNYSVKSVARNGKTILPNDNGEYTFICDGNSIITVTIIEGTIEAPTGVVNYDITSNAATTFTSKDTSYKEREVIIDNVKFESSYSAYNKCTKTGGSWNNNEFLIASKDKSETITITSNYAFTCAKLNLISWYTDATILTWEKVEYYNEENSTWVDMNVTNSSSSVETSATYQITTGDAEFSSKQVRFTFISTTASNSNPSNIRSGLQSVDLTY